MGFFDRLGNVGRGWVSTKTKQARDADLVGAAEKKLAQARDALARTGQDDPALDESEERLRSATDAELAVPKPARAPSAPQAAPLLSSTPDEERPLAPEKDEDGNIIKRL